MLKELINRFLQPSSENTVSRTPRAKGGSGGNLKIYISYRRNDSAGITGRLFDRLTSHFGSNNVFMDIGSIPLGVDFASALEQEISQCDVVIVVIGRTWLQELAGLGLEDFVRKEVEIALAIDKAIVPILVDEANMPSASDLPPSIQPIAFRNAISISSSTEFHRDLDILISGLERIEGKQTLSGTAAQEIEVEDFPRTRVFLSHATDDRIWVENEVVHTLEESKIPSWYARTDIKTATQWEREILKGMENCGWFLLVASPRSANSEWVKDEVFWAMQYRPSNFITVIMEPCDLYQFHLRLPRLQHIDFQSLKTSDAHRELVNTILT